MKFNISSKAFSSRLLDMGRVIVSKNSVAILECFVFDVKDGKLTIMASDNENTLVSSVALNEHDGEIRFAVNAKTVQESMKEIPDQPLDIFVNETTFEVTVDYQNGQYKFMGQSAEEYPVPPALEGETTTFRIDSEQLISGIGRALFATADDTLRPVMNGVFFDIKENKLAMVASDGHKLACGEVENVGASEDGSFILPKKPASLVKALFGNEKAEVGVEFNMRNAVFTTETSTLICRLIEGHYPNYKSVIPNNNPNEAIVNRAGILSALRRMLIFSNVNSSLVKLNFEPSRITISTQDIDFSMSATESLICDYSGTPMSIGFKGTYLMDLLNNMDGEEIVIRLADATRAGIIVPTNQPEGASVLMLLMPMMLND